LRAGAAAHAPVGHDHLGASEPVPALRPERPGDHDPRPRSRAEQPPDPPRHRQRRQDLSSPGGQPAAQPPLPGGDRRHGLQARHQRPGVHRRRLAQLPPRALGRLRRSESLPGPRRPLRRVSRPHPVA
ncbi:MAG: hypothetical protein ACK55Z_24350, partial [bacterium]